MWRATGIGLSALVLSCSGCAKPPETAPPVPPRVTVAHPESREVVDYNEYNGWTDASATVEVRSRVRGHIATIHFTDGQIVEKDQLLFELDARPFAADIDVAEAQVEVAKAQLDFSKSEESRQQDLFEKKVNTQSDLQKAIATRKTWESNVVSASEEVRRKQLDLEYSRISSPIKGKIGRAMLSVGNLVNAGGSDPLLTTIVALDPMHVYFFVDERALLVYRQRNAKKATRAHDKPLKESQIPVEFGLETDTGFPHRGLLDFGDNRIDPKTGTIEVRGVVDNADSKFLPGSRVRVRIPASEPYVATLVPDEAVLSDQDQRYLLCLNKDRVVVRRNVVLGRLLDDGMRVILPSASESDALHTDDWVVVLGLQRARVNYPVEPMNADGQPIADAASAP